MGDFQGSSDNSFGVLKEDANFQKVVFFHLDRISRASTDINDYLNLIEAFEDMLSPYFDEHYFHDIDKLNIKTSDLKFINKTTGKIDEKKQFKAQVEYSRYKFRILMRLALRKNFLPAGELDDDLL